MGKLFISRLAGFSMLTDSLCKGTNPKRVILARY